MNVCMRTWCVIVPGAFNPTANVSEVFGICVCECVPV